MSTITRINTKCPICDGTIKPGQETLPHVSDLRAHFPDCPPDPELAPPRGSLGVCSECFLTTTPSGGCFCTEA